MKIILISGKAGHGKDTTAGFLKAALEADGQSVLITHYGDLVKYVCKAFFGWDGEKDEKGRGLLQRVGTDVVRSKQPNYWVKFITDIVEFFMGEWDYMLIPDYRYPNEEEYLKSAGLDVIHLRVVRDGFESQLTPEQQAHSSETALDGVQPDCYITNSGSMEDLQNAVIEFLVELTGGHQMTFDELEGSGTD